MLSQQEDGELAEVANEELHSCRSEIEKVQESLVLALIPRDKADSHSAVLEVRAGQCWDGGPLIVVQCLVLSCRGGCV